MKPKTLDPVVDLSLDTIEKKKQAIVFVNTKRSAEKSAEDIAKKIKKNEFKLNALGDKILKALGSPTKQCERLSKCIRSGIAYHHAGLVQKQRELVEDGFRDGLIKIICATPTLAAGVDLPAFRAIIRDVRRYGGRFGMNWIPVLEYMQQSGRAGRPKFDKFGESIVIASTDAEKVKIIDKYLNGEPEAIESKLAVEPVLRTYLLSLIAANFIESKEQILNFFSKTFWAHHFDDMDRLEAIIMKMLNLLEDFDFIRSTKPGPKSDFVSADEIGSDKYKVTLIGKRVAELYIDPLSANHLIRCMQKENAVRLNAFSFLQMVSHTIEMYPLLKARVKDMDDIQEELAKYSDTLLENEPSLYDIEYEEFINSIQTTLFFNDWIDEKKEEYLLEKYNIRPGEIKVKLDKADWLLYASTELARILQKKNFQREITKVRLRLKNGVREELLPLLKLKGVGRIRARRLYSNKIKDLKDAKKADVVQLVQIIGRDTAIKVKEQLGQKIDKIPKKRRTGQLSLDKYKTKKHL